MISHYDIPPLMSIIYILTGKYVLFALAYLCIIKGHIEPNCPCEYIKLFNTLVKPIMYNIWIIYPSRWLWCLLCRTCKTNLFITLSTQWNYVHVLHKSRMYETKTENKIWKYFEMEFINKYSKYKKEDHAIYF